MSAYLVVVSRDVADEGESRAPLNLASDLARSGADVIVWLVHNAALAVREKLAELVLAPLVRFGVKVLVDDFSVRERGIPTVSPLACVVPIDEVVGHLADGRKTLWS